MAVKTQRPIAQRLTPVRLAIVLLLQNTEFAQRIDINEFWLNSSAPGIALLQALIQLLQQCPHYTAAHILEHWRDKPEHSILGKLAATELLLPSTAYRQEFDGALAKIKIMATEILIQDLLNKANTTALTPQEKKLLTDLIRKTKTS